MMSCDIGLSLSDFSMIISRSIHVAAVGIISLFFYGWVIFYCTCVHHHLYPFICRWTFRLLPYCDSNFKITNALFACGVQCNGGVIESTAAPWIPPFPRAVLPPYSPDRLTDIS